MILGLGIDLIEVARIEQALARFGPRFLERILCENELTYCQSQTAPAKSVASRFAAKEAVAKAFGTGIGAELGWKDIEVVRLASGQPVVEMRGAAFELLKSRGGRRVHLSLTHTAVHAAAVAVIEG